MQEATIYQQYQNQALETLTGGELVVKLFEGASKQITIAIFLINQHDVPGAYNCIVKAQKIINHLDRTLDMRYPISEELSEMYRFLFKALTEAITDKDIKKLKKILGLVDDLKVTFRQAARLARASK